MFRRHCIVAELLEETDWLVFLDADIAVVNPNIHLEDYINPLYDLTFYDRFVNWEVAAGSYIIHNTPWAKQFLRDFANFETQLPNSFHGTDNGALHIFLQQKFYPQLSAESQVCRKIWEKAENYRDLFTFEACIRTVMGDVHEFDRARILKKGTGWVRDIWLTDSKWSPERDFMLHGLKDSNEVQLKQGFIVNTIFGNFNWRNPFQSTLKLESCRSPDESTWNMDESLIVSRKEIEKYLSEQFDEVEKRRWESLSAVFLLFLYTSTVYSFEINNGVVGKPEVFCGIDTIRVKVNTEHPFNGRIYVDGESDKQHCVQHSADAHSSPQEFTIPIGACNMRRQRTLHPRGISFSFTMITSFHPFFVTGMDRAFSIRCFFLESIKGLNAEIDVGTLAPQNVDQEYSLPVCAYHLKDGIEGHVLRFAQVGQKVTHVWRCDQDASHVYGILIHSCFADDGHGNKFELVDDRGCSTDPFLLPQIEYESGAISAYTNAHVFKYADKVQLYFTCTVQLCYKHDGGCEGITPPQCSGHINGNHSPRIGPAEHKFVHGRPGTDHHNEPHENNHHNENDLSAESQFNEHESTPRVPGYIKPDSFQPIILGPPHPTVFHKDGGGSPPHHVPPFKGPSDIQRISEDDSNPIPYRRDSPLNDTTEDDIVMQVVTLRTTVPTVSHTPDLVTFKPVVTGTTGKMNRNNGLDEEEQEVMITPRSLGGGNAYSSTTKVRRTAGEMETDVSVDVIVLPVEDKERKDTNSPPQSLSFQSSSEVCLSKTSTVIFSTAVILALFCCVTVTFLVTRQRNRQLLHHASKRRIDNF
ncbi:hypothetical protein CAEBREN_19958 [Caenorhabditis brenneri]|uniref:ZP domain-containing protein n=1 Tax=Caenorhabditis brenneri TaxID=135651 RepID=G0NXS3_CAEBE|nr:hypothetical protein CAEBREN_19958 [Caenorhabditis brenneri]